MKVCCIIPAYQESRAISRVVNLTQKHCDRVVVVDDGSTDGTGRIAQESGAILLTHSSNQGKGAALRTGFKYALENHFEIIITLDGDLQHNPNSIPRFLKKISEDYDIVIGSRYTTQSEEMPFVRKLSNLITTQTLECSSRFL